VGNPGPENDIVGFYLRKDRYARIAFFIGRKPVMIRVAGAFEIENRDLFLSRFYLLKADDVRVGAFEPVDKSF